jgi:hypothetical protein
MITRIGLPVDLDIVVGDGVVCRHWISIFEIYQGLGVKNQTLHSEGFPVTQYDECEKEKGCQLC